MKPWVIYVLKCPRTQAVRYVGKTIKSVELRLREHICAAKRAPGSYKNRWLLSLGSEGLKPTVEVIETGSGDAWIEAERRWIAYYRARGAALENGTDGGDGTAVLTFEQRSAAMKKGKAGMTPEARRAVMMKARAAVSPERLSAATRKNNAARTPEQRIAAARKGRAMMTPEQRPAAGKKSMLNRTPEQRIAAMQHARLSLTSEHRIAAAKAGHAKKTPEQRREEHGERSAPRARPRRAALGLKRKHATKTPGGASGDHDESSGELDARTAERGD